MSNQATNMWFRSAPRSWEQGLPVTAGNVGAVLYGVHRDHRVMLSHKKHWLPIIQRDLPNLAKYREEMIELCQAGQYAKADAYWMRSRESEGLSGFWWHDSNHPAAELRIQETAGVAFDTRHVLDCSRGEGRIEWIGMDHDAGGAENTSIRVQGLNAPEVIVLRWAVNSARGVDGRISLNALPLGRDRGMGGQLLRDYVSIVESTEDADVIVTGTYCTGERYETRARVYVDDQPLEAKDGEWTVSGGAVATVLIAISDPEQGDPATADLESKLTSVWSDLQGALTLESERFADVYDRVSIQLGAEDRLRALPTDSLLERARSDRDDLDNALCEKIFSVGRYLIWSASQPGAFPSHLQGAWNGRYDAPWQCGYTQDENVQLHYWQLLAGNMEEATQPYFDYIDRQLPDWRESAEKIHGLPGVFATINASRNGLQFHAGADWPWDWYTGAAGWLAQYYWEHYLYTQDCDFLREKTVPLLKEIVAFYEGYAGRDSNGNWECVPSISPENTPLGRENKLCNTTTMDVAIAKEVYTNLLSACDLLELDEPDRPTWESTLSSMPAYKLNQDGAIKEWMDSELADNYNHRHQSHIYPVFPGFEINPDAHAEMLPAFSIAVEKRLGVGMKDQVGWSLSHMAGIFARLGDGERAYDCLKELANGFLNLNLFSYCQPGHIAMNLDGILGGAAAVQEMLLQGYPHAGAYVVRLLPALPKAWPEGTFNGLRVRGGGVVSATWSSGRVTHLTLNSRSIAVEYILVVNGERHEVQFNEQGVWCYQPSYN